MGGIHAETGEKVSGKATISVDHARKRLFADATKTLLFIFPGDICLYNADSRSILALVGRKYLLCREFFRDSCLCGVLKCRFISNILFVSPLSMKLLWCAEMDFRE